MPQPTLRTFDPERMVLSRNAVECFAKIAMTALQSGRVTMCLLPDHDPLRLIILERAACEIINQELGTVVKCKQISIAAVTTDQILPPANDRMAERAVDRICFDNTPPNQQEFRATDCDQHVGRVS
jgi:hypothetical protein